MQPSDKELLNLYKQFVLVRITNFKGVDTNFFRFDYDLTFAVMIMAPNGHTYSRYGTHGEMSVTGYKNTLKSVLAAHKKSTPPPQATLPTRTLQQIPTFANTKKAKDDCYHCHYANEAEIGELRAAGKFKKSLLFRYPPPEKLGINLDTDVNTLVKTVSPNSPASQAGIQPDDKILMANNTPIHNTADLQFALDSVPDGGTVRLTVLRNGKEQTVGIALRQGWRTHDISWRASQGGIPPQIGIWAEPLNQNMRQQLGLAKDTLALRVSFFFPEKQWAKTRGNLKINDIIVGINGKPLSNLTTRQFHSYIRLNHEVGERISLDILRNRQAQTIELEGMAVGDE